MAWSPRLGSTAAALAADVICNQATSGYLKLYSGTQPATVNTAPTTAEVILAALKLSATGFGASSSGICATTAYASDTSADATGTATWFRVWDASTLIGVFDGSVGATTADNLVLNSVAISSGASVSISSFTFTLPLTS